MRGRDQIDNFDGKLLAVSIGYALFLAWFSQAEVAVSSGRASGEVALLTNVALCVDLAALVLISCLSSLIGTLRNRKAVVTSLGVVLSVASIVHGVVSLGAVQGGFLAALGGVAVGLGRAGGALVWMDLFSSLPLRKVCVLFPLASLAGAILRFAIGLLPATLGWVVFAACGVASMLLVARFTGAALSAERCGEGGRWTFPFKPIVLMGMYAFAYSLSLDIARSTSLPLPSSAVGSVMVDGAVLLAAVVTRGLFDIKPLYLVALPCVAVALLGSLSCFASLALPTPLFGSLGFFSFSVFTNLLLMSISYRYGVNPLWLFGFARAARVLATGAAGACSGWATTALLGDAAAALTLVALIVVASTLLTTEDYVTTWGITPVDRQENSQTAIPTKADLYARLSRRYGLTRREEEVLALLADGASTADIERELVISNGTARNHIQHVYKKMGLRSRQQVQAFVSDELAGALRNSRP